MTRLVFWFDIEEGEDGDGWCKTVCFARRSDCQICRAMQEALNAIDGGLWVVAQAKNGKVVTAEIWANEDDARQRFMTDGG